MVQFDEEKQDERVRALHRKEEEELIASLSRRHGVPYLDLSTHPINIDALRIIKEADARAAKIAVFDAIDKKIDVAVLSPENEKTVGLIGDLKRRSYVPKIFMVSHQSLEKVWSRYKDLSYSLETKSGALDISNEEIIEMTKRVTSLADVKKLIEGVLAMKRAYRISKILEIILAGAISLRASDVHLEPEEKDVRLRYRLDGILTDILHFDFETFELLLSRIKLISELKLNVKEKAQDGRFSIKLADVEIEVLGIHPHLLMILKKEIRKPNGMILTTGPTGSGKTTTLYAFLKKIYTPDIKVVTIEDPIEYHLEGVVQTQAETEKGYNFAEGLRSALRQDPDVIMIGEIRDNETAAVAVNAALTGHLVLSTLHTNNAAGSFPRLLDLGVNPKVVSSALNVSIAQRLVRARYQSCKKESLLEGADKEKVEKILSEISDKIYLEGVQKDKNWTPVGCPECNGLGYKGRIGVYEAILIDAEIEKAVIKNPSERDIREAAKPQKMLTLAQDGVIKVLKGVTSMEELSRVVALAVGEDP